MTNPVPFDAMSKLNITDFFQRLFDSDFMPHGHCFYWRPDVLWLSVLSDAFIALAYYAIPMTLAYFVIKRRDIPFNWIFLMFGAFIIACGTTHLIEIWTVWNGAYRLEGIIKFLTAVLSVATAIVLIPLTPKILAFPNQEMLIKELSQKADQLEKVNRELGQFNDLALGREERVIELKSEVNQLCKELKRDEPYGTIDKI